jgi:type I restriction enzyme R subunit
MPLNEADTRAQLIDPMLNVAGWTRSRVTREHYYRPDWQYTAGRVVLRGGRADRLSPRRIDYLLRYTASFPIAIVEAKDEGKAAVVGLEQAKHYAKENNLMFAYTTNGHEIIEWDGFTDTTREINKFPGPEELWERWQLNTGLPEPPEVDENRLVKELRPKYDAALAAARRRNPLLHPYAAPEVTRGKVPYYFQEVAIRARARHSLRSRSPGNWSSRGGCTSAMRAPGVFSFWPIGWCYVIRHTTHLGHLLRERAIRGLCWTGNANSA